MIPDEAAVKEAVDSASRAPCLNCATHIPLRVLAAALREAQDDAALWARRANEEVAKSVAAEARIRELENGQDGNNPHRLVSVDYLRQIHEKSDRASALERDLLASSLESRELRLFLENLKDETAPEGTMADQAVHVYCLSALSRPSKNAERAEKVLRVVEAAREYVGDHGYCSGHCGACGTVKALAALDSRSEGA